jgi:hypothetical protein
MRGYATYQSTEHKLPTCSAADTRPATGRAFNLFAGIDRWHRKGVRLQANLRPSGQCMAHAEDEAAIQTPGWPQAITVETGHGFTSKVLNEWASPQGIKLDWTRLRKPTDKVSSSRPADGCGDELLNVNGVRQAARCQGDIEAQVVKRPPPPKWLARQPDPERARQQEVSSSRRSRQPVVQNCLVSRRNVEGV